MMNEINSITHTGDLPERIRNHELEKSRPVSRPVRPEDRGCWQFAYQLNKEETGSGISDIRGEEVKRVKRHIDNGTLAIKSDEIADTLLFLSK